jgi:hypothetical protein
MGVVAIGGAFAGLDFYTANATNTYDPSSTALLARAPNGTFSHITSTNTGGSINALCALGSTVYIAGNFSSLSGSSYANIAAYDTSSYALSGLQSGLDDIVYTLYCESSSGKLWAGGDFKAPVGASGGAYDGSVAVYDTKASSWSPPAFAGLSGESSTVRSITSGTGTSASSLYFAGSFATTFGSNSTVHHNNNPNVPFSSGASPFSTALVPIPLNDSDINANPSSTESGYSDIGTILCPAGPDGPGNTWFSADGQQTQITIRTDKFQNARGIRLGNTFISDHGTKTFE